MESKPAKIKAVFLPRTMGVFILLIIALSFAAGEVRREMVLTLTGAVFLFIWSYCFVMTLLLALIHRRRACTVSIRLSPEKITCGEWTQVIYSPNRKFFELPLILVRCRLLLSTRDGRRITYDFKPEKNTTIDKQEMIKAEKRGAYFSTYDELAIFDILGFFRFAFRIPTEEDAREKGREGVRLLVGPRASLEPVPIMAKGGDSDRRDAPVIERTDDLIDHRPYVPGDDPRRINWKLYSHGEELFIRQGEREPPPHSNITILIDTQVDLSLVGKSSGTAAQEVDLLCENALAIIVNATEKDIQIGFNGQTEKNRNSLTAAELGYLLAYPAACPINSASFADLPQVPEDRAILILALPRVNAENSALDTFLSNNANRKIELIFICSACENNERTHMERMAAAEKCAAFYNRRHGVTARAIGVR